MYLNAFETAADGKSTAVRREVECQQDQPEAEELSRLIIIANEKIHQQPYVHQINLWNIVHVHDDMMYDIFHKKYVKR